MTTTITDYFKKLLLDGAVKTLAEEGQLVIKLEKITARNMLENSANVRVVVTNSKGNELIVAHERMLREGETLTVTNLKELMKVNII